MDAIKVKLIGLSRGGGGNLQPDKTATPTKQEQTVRADPGYDGLRQVTVEAIPDQYADVSGVDAGAGDVRVGKVIVGSDGETITGTMPPQKPEEIGYATPTEQAQTVTPTAGSVFSAVEVDAIPSEYADVRGVDATAADVRTGKTIVDAQGDTVTGEMEPQKPEQVKSATPTTSPQSVTPDTGYALSRVDVGAIPSEYADVSDVTATAGTVLTGSDFVDASGTLVHGACDYDADTSDADATAGQIEAGATAYVGGAKVTGTMPVRSADVEISDLSPVAIPAGSYDGTAKARLADPTEVDAQYIAQGHEILGVQGSYQGADNLVAANDNALTEYTSNDITTVRKYMFVDATSLERVNIPNAVSIGDYAFQGCTSLSDINFPNVETIGGGAFERIAVEHISLPSLRSVTGAAVFSNSSATTADFPNLETIVSSLVPYCQNLVSINVPKLTAVKESTFVECRSLTSINLPSVLTVSNNYGFLRCSALQLIDFGAVTSISGTAVFHYCSSLTTIIIRTGAVCTLNDINKLNATPFASNGTGGTLYVWRNLLSQYEQATNWSVILAYTNNQILPIEGSPYEVTS